MFKLFKHSHTITDHLFSVGWLFVMLMLGLDSLGSKETTLSLLKLSSSSFAIFYLGVLTFFRYYRNFQLNKSLVKFTQFFTVPMSLVLGLSLSVLEYVTPNNYVYSLTRINPEILVALAHFGLAVVIISSKPDWLKKYGRRLAWIAPIWLLFIHQWTQLLPFDLSVFFTIEDGPVETIQNLIILTIVALCLSESWSANAIKNTRRFYLFLLVSVIFLFIGMEEISWGQRILNTQTPDKLSAVNVQNETNFHNIGILNQLQIVVYILLSGAVFCIPVLQKFKLLKIKAWSPPLISGWYMTLPLIVFVHFLLTSSYFIHSEVIEILFYGGLLFWVASKTKSFVI